MKGLIAQRIDNPVFRDTPLENLAGSTFVSSLVRVGITVILIVGVVTFAFMLLASGVQWMTTGGDKMAAEESRKRVINALIGIVIMFATWAVITLVEDLFGIDIVSIDLAPLQIGGPAG